MRRRYWQLLEGIIMIFIILTTSTSGFAKDIVKLTYGGCPSSSGVFVYTVAMTRAINDQVPEVNVTNMETTASVENARLIHRGDIDFGMISVDVQFRFWNGIDEFKGMENRTIRKLWLYATVPHTVFVTKESGITSIYQLNDKKFSAGTPGTGTEALTHRLFEANGIKPIWFRAGLSVQIEAVKNRQIVGFVKSGAPDSSIQDVASLIPIVLLPIPDEALIKANEKYPGLFPPTHVPAKSYPGQNKEVQSFPIVMHDLATLKLSEDLGYKMCRAVYNAREKIIKSYTQANEIMRFPENAFVGPIPIHAGMYKFCMEMGVKVPDSQIPPEVKR